MLNTYNKPEKKKLQTIPELRMKLPQIQGSIKMNQSSSKDLHPEDMKRSYLQNIIKDTAGVGFKQKPIIKKFNPKKAGIKQHLSTNNHTMSNFRSQNISMDKL